MLMRFDADASGFPDTFVQLVMISVPWFDVRSVLVMRILEGMPEVGVEVCFWDEG